MIIAGYHNTQHDKNVVVHHLQPHAIAIPASSRASLFLMRGGIRTHTGQLSCGHCSQFNDVILVRNSRLGIGIALWC